MCDMFGLFACADPVSTGSTISPTTVSSAIVGSAAVSSNPFAVGNVYPAMMPVPTASPQYMLVQTGSGPCYVPVTYAAFGSSVMSPPPAFSSPAAAQFQLPNPQQHSSFAVHSQMHPANPFLVHFLDFFAVFLISNCLWRSVDIWPPTHLATFKIKDFPDNIVAWVQVAWLRVQ